MGKQKRQRRKTRRENPTGLPSVKDFEVAEAEDLTNDNRDTALQSAYEDVQSSNVEEKLSGLQTLESMSCDSVLAVQIARNGIAKKIGPLLVDPNIPVRAATASALRYIADNGKTEAHECLINDDVMTPLCALLKQYYSEWQPSQEGREKGRIDDEKETLVQAVTLLWTLCENNECAVKYANEEDLASILIKYFNVTVYSMQVVIMVAQCMLSLSEDNPTAIAKLKPYDEMLLNLLSIKTDNDTETDMLCLKTTVAGIVMNLINSIERNPMNIMIYKVITVLSEMLAIDHLQVLSNLTKILPHEKNSFSSSAKKKVQESRRIFSAQQQALEILANFCTEDEETDDDSILDGSDVEDSEGDGMEDVSMDEKSIKLFPSLPLQIMEAFESCKLLEKVQDKTKAVDKDTEEILEQNFEGKSVLKQVHSVRCRAYLCLNNLISSLEIDALGGMDRIYRMWIETGMLVFKHANPVDIELLESATAAMRAALQRMSEEKANVFNQLTLADVQPMLNGERQCPNPNVRANLIRTLGNLALILTNNDTAEAREVIKHVSTFLLETCAVESEAWVIAETLDTIMDVYAEDDSDELANNIQLVEKLQVIVPLYKNKVRQQKKKLKDSAAIVSTVNTNIMRFIKYKERRIKSVS